MNGVNDWLKSEAGKVEENDDGMKLNGEDVADKKKIREVRVRPHLT